MAAKIINLPLSADRATKPQLQPIFENLVSRTELAKRLSLSPSYISKMMKYEGLPYFKIGRAVRFKLSEVVDFLERKCRKP